MGVLFMGITTPQILAQEFSILIDGEKNPRIDKNYIYVVKILNDPGDNRLLEVFIEHEIGYLKIYEWEYSRYDKDLTSNVILDMSKFDWDLSKTYRIVAKIDTTVSSIEIQPKHWNVVEDSPKTLQTINPSIDIVGMLETKLPQQYRVGFDICSGSKDLVTPAITVNTDMASDTLEVMSIIGAGSCLFYEVTIKANDPDSVNISFGNVVTNDVTTENLQRQIDELKAELEKKDEQLALKDAILMEQLKVIQQLASSFKKTIFEPISYYFGFA